ncbi:hypothetical protein [Aeromicrobium massiliense]|uniref:hypothetical protein n=1 Tax=Aeromicrobium massiliense TaxID=1464554 RepID=UPI0002FABFFC|nr:hypothetical protein [Aeromicrobium massiliense]
MAEADDDTAAGRHAADPQPHSWWTHLKALGTVVVALVLGAFFLLDLPTDRAAARDEGVPGIVTVTDESCGGRGGCSYDGTFVSLDGRLRLEDAYLVDVGGEVGDRFDAQYFASNDSVYSVGSGEWRLSLAAVAAAAAWIVGYGVWLRRDVRLRRRLRHARASDAGRPE